jgi:hypothetical protein
VSLFYSLIPISLTDFIRLQRLTLPEKSTT